VGTHLEFDLGLAKEEGDKNPVFYLQYAHARICSILRKAAERNVTLDRSADLSVLNHRHEIELIGLLSRMQSAVERACENLEPHTVAEYLRDVAAAYHNFYHDCRILGSEPHLESARLVLEDVTRRAIRNGLLLLGVCKPELMYTMLWCATSTMT
jgi:arginyl-tRNA synthetase